MRLRFHSRTCAKGEGFLASAVSLTAFALLTSVSAVAGDGVTANLLAAPDAPPPSVVADFDGDHKLDLATLATLNSKLGGLLQQIHIQFGVVQSPVFNLLIRPFANRLDALDLDGDNDRDLVLESPLREPLAVWINDGAGNFHEGNLENFRFQLSHGDPRSIRSAERVLPLLRTGECPRRSAALKGVAGRDPDLVGTELLLGRIRPSAESRYDQIWTRGPPWIL